MIKGRQIYHIKLDQYKTVFTVIPKNANTSIKYAIIKSFTNHNLKKIDINNPDQFHSKTLGCFDFIDTKQVFELENYLRIVIVRNPFDRLVSGWASKIRNLKRPRFGFNQACSFDEFIRIIYNIPEYDLNRHFIPQYRFITHGSHIVSDKIIKLEDLNKEWKQLQLLFKNRNNIDLIDPPLLNSTSVNRQHYNKYTIELIKQKFERDLELFNYLL